MVRYDTLKPQLTRRLGSPELARDALHYAYVRLNERDELDDVRHPQSYVHNVAVNGAIDQMRRDARLLSESEVDALYAYADPAAGPAEEAQARFELEHVMKALDALPPRPCDILYSARIEGATQTGRASCRERVCQYV